MVRFRGARTAAAIALAVALIPSAGTTWAAVSDSAATLFIVQHAQWTNTVSSDSIGPAVWAEAGRVANLHIGGGVVTIGAPVGSQLAVGHYADARYPEVSGKPILGCVGVPLICSGSGTQSFDVLDIQTAADGSISSLAIRARDGSGDGAEYRYQSSVAIVNPVVFGNTDDLDNFADFGFMLPGTTATHILTITNPGTADGTIGTITVENTLAAGFTLSHDTCSSTTLAPGAQCTAQVTVVTPSSPALMRAIVHVPTNAERPQFDIDISAHVVRATTMTLTASPDPVARGSNLTLTAKITPKTAVGVVHFHTPKGTTVDGTVANGTASVVVQAVADVGPATYMADYQPYDDQTGSVSGQVTVKIGYQTEVDFVYPSSPTPEGEALTFRAHFNGYCQPPEGTFRIRDTSDGKILASTSITAYDQTLVSNPVVLTVGTHPLIAEYLGQDLCVPASATWTQVVQSDSSVDVGGLAVSPSTFYPVADGYLDITTIRGTPLEPVTVTINIFNESGTKVWTRSLARRDGTYNVKWNGHSSAGALLPAGKYRVVQHLVDAKGNKRDVTIAVTLSHRKVKWITATVTKAANATSSRASAGSGSISTSSSYSNGIKITGGSRADSYGLVRYEVTVHGGLAYRNVSLGALGRGTTSSSKAILAFGEDPVGSLIGPGYKWWTRSGGADHVIDGLVTLDVEADGPMSGWFDIAKVRVTVQYAVWA